ncbi:UDP-2,4-diacetamido-2,4,6-trideoxy-beta-L-altropyranose hydrolase [Bradyrhizobium sp. NBAIM14]|uniref:UDP-2,4-diacetamido-2,4, 6-trideoxy-beta-L-altropyranose hydrolase n=1 Tax=Bradyrhizobium sp. NBAIM14 TaxID=2793814 RepID=UPI001CD62DD3|nr:UDP-2,4-diacetamido-2,4,6-trideoxy-beta-L-altropyranose hydrolase [Bradyrhizobium sp. NBAIM14]MCA1501867.1 UDP-2,4-diacetamido-2,4,6-trideoxy-beta-L-altropyranose hydrolase [Bradyrhizobium sp. NBAIM14]
MQRVVFRVDASVQMGLGHLTRCLTLANALAERGAKSCFLLRSNAAGVMALVEENGHDIRLLPDPPAGNPLEMTGAGMYAHWLPITWRQDARQTSEAMDQIGAADWLIVDHYALDSHWENACRRDGLRILAIDDLADRQHDCDILLDQNLVREMHARYRDQVPKSCVKLLGPRYALLRPDFAQQRRMLPSRSGQIGRILVCYGGSDPTNETAKAVRAIASLQIPSVEVDVVLGLSNPHTDSIERLCSGLSGMRVYRGANNIAELMRRADLSIGAGGVMSWERCCLGLPAVVVDIADNQVGALTALADAGAALYLGSATEVTVEMVAEGLLSLFDSAPRVRTMGEAAFGLVDGEGRNRVVARMCD